MALTGTFPFGDHPFVARDGVFQYVGLHGWYHQVLTGQDNLFYSFAKGLGGGTFPLFAYYLSSPVSLLAAFVQPKDIGSRVLRIHDYQALPRQLYLRGLSHPAPQREPGSHQAHGRRRAQGA